MLEYSFLRGKIGNPRGKRIVEGHAADWSVIVRIDAYWKQDAQDGRMLLTRRMRLGTDGLAFHR